MKISSKIVATVTFVLAVSLPNLPGAACLSAPIKPIQTSRMDRRAATASMTTIPALLFTDLAHAETDLSGYKEGPEGIKYLVTQVGTGDKPQRGQKIQTSYTLWINGFPGDSPKSKKIDSSSKPVLGDQPFKVRAGVSQVIRGWDLTLMDMQEGEARRIIVPPSLGYGPKGVGPIPGDATLYFDMKLTFVEPMKELTDDAKAWLETHPL